MVCLFPACVLRPICVPVPETSVILWGTRQTGSPGAFVQVGGTGSVPGLMIMHSLSSLIAHRISKGRKDSLRGYISCISTKRRSKVS